MPRASVEIMADAGDLMLLDEGSLDKTKHYRFVQDRPESIARRRAQGYQVVLQMETGVKLVADDLIGGRSDDQIRVGDTVLMMCDKTRYSERRKRKSQLAEQRLGGPESGFKGNAQRKGVRTVTDYDGD